MIIDVATIAAAGVTVTKAVIAVTVVIPVIAVMASLVVIAMMPAAMIVAVIAVMTVVTIAVIRSGRVRAVRMVSFVARSVRVSARSGFRSASRSRHCRMM